MQAQPTKKCSKCGERKPLDAFHRRKANKTDGREPCCKACRALYYQANRERYNANTQRWREQNRERTRELYRQWYYAGGHEWHTQWRADHREELNTAARARYLENPEKEAERRADYLARNPTWGKDYYWANHEAELERGRQKYSDNREKERARKKAYRAANRHIGREGARRRRARQRNVTVDPVDEGVLILRDEGRCGICGGPIMGLLEVDHIIPITRGGEHSPGNCQLSHRSCNRQKHDRLPEECPEIQPLND